MEFADSEIRRAEWQGGDLCIEFSAVSVARHLPAQAPQRGYLQGVAWRLRDCTPMSAQVSPGRVREGVLRLQGQLPLRRMIIPTTWLQPLTMELESALSSLLVVQAQGLECRWRDETVFRESLFC